MYPDFKFKTGLEEYTCKYLRDINDYFDDLKIINMELNRLITDGTWTGDAQLKCARAQELIEEYRADLAGLNVKLEHAVGEAASNAGAFIHNSQKVQSIRNI